MGPSELSATLRRIASRIDASKSPSKTLVSRDLKRVLASVVKNAAEDASTLNLSNSPEELKQQIVELFNSEYKYLEPHSVEDITVIQKGSEFFEAEIDITSGEGDTEIEALKDLYHSLKRTDQDQEDQQQDQQGQV